MVVLVTGAMASVGTEITGIGLTSSALVSDPS